MFKGAFTHWAVSHAIMDKLNQFGIQNVHYKPDFSKCYLCLKPCPKIPHEGFNVVVYMPPPKESLFGNNRAYVEWVYGFDIIREVMQRFPANWIVVDGSQCMCDVWPYADAYIRPNRHDGAPRMVMEAKRLHIPTYWDREFKPTTEKVINFLEELKC